MPRQMLNDEHWSKLKAIMLEERIYDKPNLRNTVEGILYRIRTGCPWRDVPVFFGNWNSIYKRFNAWSKHGIIANIFKALVSNADTEWEFIDGSIVRAHQHSTGAVGEEPQAIGKSCGGNSSKILLAVDAYGLPIYFEIVEGQEHDSKSAPELIEKLPPAAEIIADKGFDSEEIREAIREHGAKPVIPRRSNSKKGNDDMDWWLYKYRHLVENAFARLKHFRAVATRYDKLKRNYHSVVAFACGFIWLPM
jgi:transposase